jgi:hypothetical protein
MVLLNEAFFISNDLDLSLFDVFLKDVAASLERDANGEALLRNAAPAFDLPLSALFCPRQEEGAALALFYRKPLSESFGAGANETCIVNGEADLLVHSSQGFNMAEPVGNEPVFLRLQG